MPPPEPPIVNEGRMMHGKPISSSPARAASRSCTTSERVVASPMSFMAWRKRSRSSAMSMASGVAPIISTPYFSSTPSRSRSSAQLSAVWPPMVGRMAPGRSRSMMRSTTRQSMGSM